MENVELSSKLKSPNIDTNELFTIPEEEIKDSLEEIISSDFSELLANAVYRRNFIRLVTASIALNQLTSMSKNENKNVQFTGLYFSKKFIDKYKELEENVHGSLL